MPDRVDSNNRADAEQRRFRASLVRRAIEDDSPLLAAPLDRYVREEGRSWSQLASRLECSVDQLHRIACCYPPRDSDFLADAETIALVGGVPLGRILPLLRHLQVTGAFRENTADIAADSPPNYYLAARDREDEEQPPP